MDMSLYARNVMVTSFDRIHQDAPIDDAIRMILNGKIRRTGHKTVSLIVVDDYGQMAGVITMYDILFHLRPDFLNLSVDADTLQWKGQLKLLVESLKQKRVGQLMSTNVMSAAPDDHVMVILDRMIKNKFRRLPVLEGDRPVGVIYISDVYHSIFNIMQYF